MKNNPIGTCPLCKKGFNAKDATIAFPAVTRDNQIYLVFALCPFCNNKFLTSDLSTKRQMATRSIQTFYANKFFDWTVTTSLALAAHDGDFYSAWWIGIDIPKELFDLINNGHIDSLSFLQGGAQWDQ